MLYVEVLKITILTKLKYSLYQKRVPLFTKIIKNLYLYVIFKVSGNMRLLTYEIQYAQHA